MNCPWLRWILLQVQRCEYCDDSKRKSLGRDELPLGKVGREELPLAEKDFITSTRRDY